MKWCKTIWVCAVNYLKHFIFHIKLLLCVTQYLVDFVSIPLVNFGPIVHLNFLSVLLSLLLLSRFLWYLRHCHIGFALSRCCSSILLGIASAVACKLICLLIIISEINLFMLLRTPLLFLGGSKTLSRFIVRRARGCTVLHCPKTILNGTKLLTQFVSIVPHSHEVVLWGRVLNLWSNSIIFLDLHLCLCSYNLGLGAIASLFEDIGGCCSHNSKLGRALRGDRIYRLFCISLWEKLLFVSDTTRIGACGHLIRIRVAHWTIRLRLQVVHQVALENLLRLLRLDWSYIGWSMSWHLLLTYRWISRWALTLSV